MVECYFSTVTGLAILLKQDRTTGVFVKTFQNFQNKYSLLRLIFLHFVSALSNPSFFVKLFYFFFFFSCFLSCFFSALMLCKPGFFFLFRNNVSFKTVSGESKAVTPEMVAELNETTLPTLLFNYDLENIYNADKFRLFCQCLPDKSCQLKTEKCSGGKHNKIRITSLAAANAVGNKLPMFAIRKEKNPRCFKNIKKLLRRYRSQRKRMGERKQKQKILSRRKTSSIGH